MLARLGTEGEGDVTPGVEAGCRRRQMQDDAAHRDDHVDAQLEQSLAQPRDLGPGIRGARGPQSEFLHEHVGGRGEQHAPLIGPEATAARAPDLEPVVKFFDPILNVAAHAVDVFIDEAGRLPESSDEKTGVVARGPILQPRLRL